jgi:hypothetical protein
MFIATEVIVKRRLLLFFFFLVLAASSAFAQFSAVPALPGKLSLPGVGAWASYIQKTGAEQASINFAVVGEEQVGGKRCLWYEFTRERNSNLSVVKILLPADEGSKGEIKRMIVKDGDDPAVEVPLDLFPSSGTLDNAGEFAFDPNNLDQARDEVAGKGGRLEKLGEETITVHGKPLKCEHLKASDSEGGQAELWFCDEVPFFSLIRMRGSSFTLDLDDWGDTGAKTRITETPRKLDLKGMLDGLK